MKSSTRTIALNPLKGIFAGMAFVFALACAQGASAADRVHVSAGFQGLHAGVSAVNFRNRSSRSFRNNRNSQRRFRNRSNFSLSLGGFNRGYYNPGYYDRGLSLSIPLSSYSRGCERVSTRGFWNGRRANVGGRRCFDARGYGYIVPNSRFLIGYY